MMWQQPPTVLPTAWVPSLFGSQCRLVTVCHITAGPDNIQEVPDGNHSVGHCCLNMVFISCGIFPVLCLYGNQVFYLLLVFFPACHRRF